jgi:hypothetical protein
VIIPITFPFSLTNTHLANLTKDTSAFAGVDSSTRGGGGSMTEPIFTKCISLSLFSIIILARSSSVNMPTNLLPLKTGI